MSLLSSRSRWLGAALILLSSLAFADGGDVVPPEVITRVEATLPVNAAPPIQDHVLLEFTVGAGHALDRHDVGARELRGKGRA